MRKYVVSICVMLLAGCAFAQQDTPAVEPMAKTPVFRVKVVSRTTKAVNYRHRGGSTMVDFKGTSLMPEASGKGKVDSKAGRLEISADFAHLAPASKFGAQYRSEEHTSELQSRGHLVCRLLLETKKNTN